MFICSVCEHGYDDRNNNIIVPTCDLCAEVMLEDQYDDYDHVSEEAMADALHWERAEVRDWTHNHGEWNSQSYPI